MTDFTNFNEVVAWVINHGYLIIFLIMCVEGPMITAASGFASALGYFNPWIILILAILGDLVPDTIYYYLGYFSRFTFIEKIGYRLGLTKIRIVKMESGLKDHFGKTMVAMKLTPFITTFGFILVGYLRQSFIRFMKYCAGVTVPKAILFLTIGYFFGHLYNINQYLRDIRLLMPAAAVVFLGLYFLNKRISRLIAGKIERL